MIKEIAKTIYLFMFQMLFTFFSFFSKKNKIVFVTSFKENNLYTYREIKEKFSGEVVFLCKKNMYPVIKKSVNEPVFQIEAGKLHDEIMAAYHLATSRTIVVDNYYGFLAVANFKNGVECIQVWHAAGAVKNFGFLDRTIGSRSRLARRRFARVYRNFHKVVVNSDIFGEIFAKAFGTKEEQFLPFGFPRTDFFFNKKLQSKLEKNFYKKYPELKKKKIILYAPTYRPTHEKNKLMLDIPVMYEQLKKDYVLLIRMHPSVDFTESEWVPYKDFAFDFSKKATINELLVASDILITDYSSIPFEYVLLKKPMIFYPYDLEDYRENPGLWDLYENIVPGPVAYSTEEIIRIIEKEQFDFQRYEEFNQKWNQYSDGHSSERLVQYILQRHEEIG